MDQVRKCGKRSLVFEAFEVFSKNNHLHCFHVISAAKQLLRQAERKKKKRTFSSEEFICMDMLERNRNVKTQIDAFAMDITCVRCNQK